MTVFFCLNAKSEVPLLSQTGLYKNIKTKKMLSGRRYYEPQYPLFSDGAKKKRWVYLPPGSKINTENLDYWVFPIGTKIWKEFRFPDAKDPDYFRRVETRYLEKGPNEKWIMATYLWNEDETEAVLADEKGIQNYYTLPQGVSVNIPSVGQCRFCHERGGDAVLSLDAVQLSHDQKGFNLQDWIEEGKLTHVPKRWQHSPPKIHARNELGRAAMGYMHANCGHCHNPTGRASMSGLFLRHSELATSEAEEPAIMTALDQLTKKFQIPGAATSYRIRSQDPNLSAVFYRMTQAFRV